MDSTYKILSARDAVRRLGAPNAKLGVRDTKRSMDKREDDSYGEIGRGLRRTLRAAAAGLVLGHDHAQVENAAIRVRVVSDAATLGQAFVALNFHAFPDYAPRLSIMKRVDVVLRSDTRYHI